MTTIGADFISNRGENHLTWEELKDKARSLPLEPGVYLMADKQGAIIYVGKAKKLKNRVSQYFQDTGNHSIKTRQMVSKIHHFDTILARSEFEALVLECSLIKRHMPKYNILLKDGKGYPYLRIDTRLEYPVMELVGKYQEDGAQYFGPFGGRYLTQNIIDTLRLALKLPGCHKQFPRDLGKERPCLNFHMNNCDGWCQYCKSPQLYRETMEQAMMLLNGKYQQVAEDTRQEMERAAEELRFEQAAGLRDRLRAIEALGQKQLVTAGSMALKDVIGYYQTEAKGCFTVLHFVDGSLLDKDSQIVPASDTPEEAVSTMVKQYYLAKQGMVKEIYLPCDMEDGELFEQLLSEHHGRRVHIRVPQRGDNVRLVELANKNAREEAEGVTSKEEKLTGALGLLQTMLDVPALHRIEAYDISNLAGTDIVASMTVHQDGKPLKKDYKRFKIKGLDDQDDYGSMRQVIERRFTHYINGDKGFETAPDALFIDGGAVHAKLVKNLLSAMGLDFPVYGMVKDNRHRTRGLVTPIGHEIGISATPSVFALVGRIQEETHRFAISYQKLLRSKKLTESKLEEIPGIGKTRRATLLKHFKSITAISKASMAELEDVIPQTAALAVYQHFHQEASQ